MTDLFKSRFFILELPHHELCEVNKLIFVGTIALSTILVRVIKWEGKTFETVVLLSQQKPDDTIEIDLDLDELDATSAETKATYQEIKDYVLKEFGLKVSSLYISQVKRKCGIEVGENYNLPKSENARVPQCPKEKEDAIKAALKYYAMI